MFQQYISPAAIDPNLPYLSAVEEGFLYAFTPETPGVSFSLAAADFPLVITQLNLVPRDSLLVVNMGLSPAALTSSRVEFFNSVGAVFGAFPLAGNGLALIQGAVPIPRDAVAVRIYFDASPGVLVGQVRVITREHIPYQPLKG